MRFGMGLWRRNGDDGGKTERKGGGEVEGGWWFDGVDWTVIGLRKKRGW